MLAQAKFLASESVHSTPTSALFLPFFFFFSCTYNVCLPLLALAFLSLVIDYSSSTCPAPLYLAELVFLTDCFVFHGPQNIPVSFIPVHANRFATFFVFFFCWF